MVEKTNTIEAFIEISKLELKLLNNYDTMVINENDDYDFIEEFTLKFNKKYIDLSDYNKFINKTNFKDFCLFCLIIDLAQIVHHQADSPFPFGVTARCLTNIKLSFNKIANDAEILLPDLDNLNKNDIVIIKEFIYLFIDRAKYMIKEQISQSKIKFEGSVKIGISEKEKSNLINENINEINNIYQEKIINENVLYTDVDSSEDEFMMEIMDIDEENELEDISDRKCPECNSENIIYVGMSKYYCYDCDNTWS